MKEIIYIAFVIFPMLIIGQDIDNISKQLYSTANKTSAIDSCDMLLKQHLQKGNLKAAAQLYKTKGNIYYMSGDATEPLLPYRKGLQLADSLGLWEISAEINHNLAIVYANSNHYLNAFIHINKAIDLDSLSGDTLRFAKSLNAKGIVYEKMEDFSKALSFYVRSLKLYETNNYEEGILKSYINIGNIYSHLKLKESSKKFYKKSYSIIEKSSKKYLNDKAHVLYSLGTISMLEGNTQEALSFLNEALHIQETNSLKEGLSKTYTTLGNIFAKNKQYGKAMDFYTKSLQLKYSLKDIYGQSITFANMGKALLAQDKSSEGISYLEQGIQRAKNIGAHSVVADISFLLMKEYIRKNEYNKALFYSELNRSSSIKEYETKTEKELSRLRISFESEQKEKENEILRKTSVIQELELRKERNFKQVFIAFSSLLSILIFFIYRSYAQKRKNNREMEIKNKLLEQKNELIVQKNKEITDSIEYAKKIQDAMLVSNDKIKQALPESFILYRPRDIVSGDFYWFSKYGYNKFVLAAIDCTGHGVPGAFMSMLGDSYLKQIIAASKDLQANDILKNLHFHIKQALKQEETNNNDGMDLALCIIDRNENKVYYSGAKSPLVYIENGECHKIKGSPFPIGGKDIKDDENTYDIHEIDATNKTFYIFSDGYQDQFGGEKGKKFMVKRLMQLFVDNYKCSFTEQKNILENALSSWQGNNDQVDDILVIGFNA